MYILHNYMYTYVYIYIYMYIYMCIYINDQRFAKMRWPLENDPFSDDVKQRYGKRSLSLPMIACVCVCVCVCVCTYTFTYLYVSYCLTQRR